MSEGAVVIGIAALVLGSFASIYPPCCGGTPLMEVMENCCLQMRFDKIWGNRRIGWLHKRVKKDAIVGSPISYLFPMLLSLLNTTHLNSLDGAQLNDLEELLGYSLGHGFIPVELSCEKVLQGQILALGNHPAYSTRVVS
jgi:hypothetical protein